MSRSSRFKTRQSRAAIMDTPGVPGSQATTTAADTSDPTDSTGDRADHISPALQRH